MKILSSGLLDGVTTILFYPLKLITMRNDIVARALRGRLINKITKGVLLVYGVDSIVSDFYKRSDVDTKRAAVWALYYYTRLPLKEIGEKVRCGYCNAMYLVKTMNALISTDSNIADLTIELEGILAGKGLVKKNRTHKHQSVGNSLDYATSYKKKTQRPIAINKKVTSILLATNDKKIIKSILKAKREQIERETNIDNVVILAKEIQALEFQLSAL